jgi:hypothetical protein
LEVLIVVAPVVLSVTGIFVVDGLLMRARERRRGLLS